MPLEIGNRVGDYEILAVLGSGGMGRVFKVRNIISNREEAMKILLPDFAADHDLAARLVAEIRTLATLEHPNIAQLRTAFRDGNQFVMVMEYVEGTTLETLATQGELSPDKILDYSTQALAALSYAHGRGVTHRDIKPANIMITAYGVVKLMDFGIAKSNNDMQLTRPGTTMGSIYYMSPEQVRGGTVDARSDIYSFGVTLYEMLTGRKPFQAETSYSVLNAQLNEAPTPPVLVNPAIPQALNNIVMRAMVKAPEGRFQTAEEFRNALKALREPQAAALPAPMPAAQPAQAAPVAQPAPPQPGFAPVPAPAAVAAASASGGKSHRGLWIGLGAVAAVLAVIVAFALLPRVFSTHAGQNQAQATQQESQASATPSDASNGAQPAAPASSATETPGPLSAASSNSTAASPAAASQPGAPTPATGAASTAAPAGARKPRQTSVLGAQSAAGSSAGSESAAPAGPSPDEIRAAHDQYSNLEARADAARQSVQQIRSQQQAQGLDIRGDILGAMNRLNTDMREADSALNRNDLAAARDYMQRADRETSTLEKFLGQ